MVKLKILIVDDELAILNAIKRTLRREDYQLFAVNSVKAAIAVLKQEQINLLITDYKMPRRTGDQLLEHAREHCPQVVRILLTGYSSTNRAESILEAGLADDLVRKPWNNDELCKLVAKHLLKETTRQDEIK